MGEQVEPPTFDLVMGQPGGDPRKWSIAAEDMDMSEGSAIQMPIMDFVCQIFKNHANTTVMDSLTIHSPMNLSREEVLPWYCGLLSGIYTKSWVIQPVQDDGVWSLLVVRHAGDAENVYVLPIHKTMSRLNKHLKGYDNP